ncbi:hypothetical protein VTJ04DRAFT_10276 [Mycothermus thermophilus]|uniref:uncharacterized protein n=1 Tax=Humicola insolens TaxID=85995 RepID=UPI003742FBF8
MHTKRLAARALVSGGLLRGFHQPHASNNSALAVRQGFCEVGKEVCGIGCMIEDGDCCDKYGYSIYCDPGYYCMSSQPACCPDGEVCSGSPEGCEPGWELCTDGCIPEGAVCCSTGYYCEAGEVCTNDGYCDPDTSIEDDFPTTTSTTRRTTTTSTRPRTTTTSTTSEEEEEEDEPTPTTDFGPTETEDADEPIPTDDGEEEEEEEEEEPTTTSRAGGLAPTSGIIQNGAGQMKMGAGGLVVTLVAGVAMLL